MSYTQLLTPEQHLVSAKRGLGLPVTSRTEAVRETVHAATENGWILAPEHEWADFDCGGGEIHIPIHARPVLG